MDRTITVQILPVHIYCSNLMIFIGRIIVNSSVCIAAGSVDSDLILPFVQLTASSGLIHAPQNMEKLADALRLRQSGQGIHLRECHPYKTGCRRQIPGQSHGSHASAVRLQLQICGKTVCR